MKLITRKNDLFIETSITMKLDSASLFDKSIHNSQQIKIEESDIEFLEMLNENIHKNDNLIYSFKSLRDAFNDYHLEALAENIKIEEIKDFNKFILLLNKNGLTFSTLENLHDKIFSGRHLSEDQKRCLDLMRFAPQNSVNSHVNFMFFRRPWKKITSLNYTY